ADETYSDMTKQMTHRKERCFAIMAKVLFTVEKHKASYPRLKLIEQFLPESLGESNEEDYEGRLQELYCYLQDFGTGPEVLQNFYQNLFVDMEALKDDSLPFFQGNSYVTIAE
ncbi:hypothetical protein, partial [Pontibacter ummariensis]